MFRRCCCVVYDDDVPFAQPAPTGSYTPPPQARATQFDAFATFAGTWTYGPPTELALAPQAAADDVKARGEREALAVEDATKGLAAELHKCVAELRDEKLNARDGPTFETVKEAVTHVHRHFCARKQSLGMTFNVTPGIVVEVCAMLHRADKSLSCRIYKTRPLFVELFVYVPGS